MSQPLERQTVVVLGGSAGIGRATAERARAEGADVIVTGRNPQREELRAKLPIGRVVGPDDVAALAVHLMSNATLTGATYDIDGGQQFV